MSLTELSDTEKPTAPLAVNPREAARMLSISVTRIYTLLRAGEIHGFRVCDRSRRITVESIQNYIDRQVAAASATGWQQLQPGRRRKKG